MPAMETAWIVPRVLQMQILPKGLVVNQDCVNVTAPKRQRHEMSSLWGRNKVQGDPDAKKPPYGVSTLLK
jgi:hypothetical protein